MYWARSVSLSGGENFQLEIEEQKEEKEHSRIRKDTVDSRVKDLSKAWVPSVLQRGITRSGAYGKRNPRE